MIEHIDLVGTYGFPIIVTAYLLWERQKFNSKMIKSLEEITATLKNVNDHIIRRL